MCTCALTTCSMPFLQQGLSHISLTTYSLQVRFCISKKLWIHYKQNQQDLRSIKCGDVNTAAAVRVGSQELVLTHFERP
jgi:hypothetical protein